MRQGKKYLSAIASAVVVVLCWLFCGCFDLGDVDDEKDYCERFTTVTLLRTVIVETEDENGNKIAVPSVVSDSYSMADFYGDEQINDFKCAVQSEPYMYLSVSCAENTVVESFALYCNAEIGGELSVEAFIVDEIPSCVRAWGESVDENKIYDDPLSSSVVAKANCNLGISSWDSFTVNFRLEGSAQKGIAVKAGQYILLRFVPNCPTTSAGQTMSFRMTAALIRSISSE